MRLSQFFREPLPWFLLIGLLIFVVDARWGSLSDEENSIAITEGQVQSLIDQWQQQMGRAPLEQELSALVEDRLREEVLYREALKIGLDQGDTIIRRRLAQKMTFVIEDTLGEAEPTEDELSAYRIENLARYRVPERFTFTHVYYSDSAGNAQERAEQGLTAIAKAVDPNTLGDPFMLRSSYAERSSKEIGRLFGEQFATTLPELEAIEQWQGPLESAYGYHIVALDKKTAAFDPSLDEIRDRVQVDYLTTQRQRQNESLYREMRAKYQITVPPR